MTYVTGHLRGKLPHAAPVTHVHPALERLEARARRIGRRVERDDLTVEDTGVLVESARECR